MSACVECRRRSWLLAALSGPLEYCARDRARLLDTLALPDEQLLRALAGRRRTELEAEYEHFQLRERRTAGERGEAHADEARSVCTHCEDYPRALSGESAPRMLEVAGGAGRLREPAAASTVAIVGSAKASDYGMAMARSVARGLSASGVSVSAVMADGIAAAALAGVLDTSGMAIAVLGGGLGASCPARMRGMYRHLTRAGCAISELPWSCDGRRWGRLASERIVVGLASVCVVVEARSAPGDVFAAQIAQALGRTVAAIPGRVTSPLSSGTHALLMDGAALVRGAQDVLELLPASERDGPRYARATHAGDGASADAGVTREPLRARATRSALGAGARRTLARVGMGCDTVEKLMRAGAARADVLLALSELELVGAVSRGEGGRYVPREPYV
jgi:DNA processing protein